MSAIDYSGTQVRGLAGLLVRLRSTRPAPTIRAAAAAPAAPPTQAGDDAEVSKHIYMSGETEPGQETTALGRFMADATIRVPLERPEPAGQTQVLNTYGVERALAAEVLEEPLLFNLLAEELGYPKYYPPVEPADLVDRIKRDPGADSVRLSTLRPAQLGDA